MLINIYSNGAINLLNERIGEGFHVNGQRVKSYLGEPFPNTMVTLDLNKLS